MAITITGIARTYLPFTEAVINIFTWAKVGKTEDIRELDAGKSARPDLTERGGIQNSPRLYQNLGEKEKIALISFNSVIESPVIIEGTTAGKDRAIEWISQLRADGGTRLYDSSLYARNWLLNNPRPDAINAVLILTDGEDSGSEISIDRLSQQLEDSNFESGENIAFFTVGYGSGNSFNPEVLQQIAQLNGGYYRKGDPQTISNLMADLQVEF